MQPNPLRKVGLLDRVKARLRERLAARRLVTRVATRIATQVPGQVAATRRFEDDDFPVALPQPRVVARGASDQERSQEEALRRADALAQWIDALDESIRPRELAAFYPQVAAEIMERWSDSAALSNYLYGLIFSERGNRLGFPEWVFVELLRLQAEVQERTDEMAPHAGAFQEEVVSLREE